MLLIKFEENFINQELFEVFYNNYSFDKINIQSKNALFESFNETLSLLRLEKSRFFLIARDNEKLIAFMFFKVNNLNVVLEDIQIEKKYRGKFLFKDFLFFAKSKVPRTVLDINAMVKKDDTRIKKILEHYGFYKTKITDTEIEYACKAKKLFS